MQHEIAHGILVLGIAMPDPAVIQPVKTDAYTSGKLLELAAGKLNKHSFRGFHRSPPRSACRIPE
jgi:hypothetical protein